MGIRLGAALSIAVLFTSACDDDDDRLPTTCSDCVDTASCNTTTAEPFCMCPLGFSGDGTVSGTGCTANDADPCANGTSNCVPGLTTCIGAGSAFACRCITGYAGDGTTSGTGCTNVNECALNTDTCVDVVATCADTQGSFSCTCAAGYSGDGKTTGSGCININECAVGTNNCVPLRASCVDTPGSFTCACNSGYTGDGRVTGTGCTDIDECLTGTHDCDADSTCSNAIGSFTCRAFFAASPFQNRLYRLQNRVIPPALTPSWITLSTTTLTPTAGNGFTGCNGFANDPTNGDLYVIVKRIGVSGRVLGTLDPSTGVVTIVGDLGDNFSSIAFRDDGQLFGTTGDGATVPETLYLIDKTNATKTVARALGNGADGEVIQFNEDDGKFYHWSGNGTVVFESVDATAPYAITGIPIVGTTSGEVFGAYWDTVEANFIIFDIGSGVHRMNPDGTYGPVEGATLMDDLRSPGYGSAARHRIEPASGAAAGGATVVLRGAGFSNLPVNPTVTFGGAAAPSATRLDDTHISVVIPAHAAGAVDVHTESGTFGFNWPAGFTYQ